MMRAHVIKDGKVVNTVEVESLDVIPNLIDAAQGGTIGDLWDGSVFSKPPGPPIADLQAVAWEAIKTERDRRKAGGYTIGGKWYHSDDGSRIQQLGLLMMGANIPAGLQWKTMDGSFVTMTPTLAGQIFQAAAVSDMAIFAKAEWHKSTMEASAMPDTYAYLQGWPLIFGE